MIHPNAKQLRPEIAADVAIQRGAPARLVNMLLGGMKLTERQHEALAVIRTAYTIKECSVLHGRVGCGKSTIGAHIVMKHAEIRTHGQMWTYAGLMDAQKSWFGNTKHDKPEAPISIAKRCRMLIIDEIVAEAGSLYDHTQLTEIIKARYDAQKPTLLITNIRPDRLAEVVTVPVADRLRDGGGIVELKGASMRGQAS